MATLIHGKGIIGERGSPIASLVDSAEGIGVGSRLLPRIRAEVDRLQRITVCTRPFRAAGPRIEAEPWRGKLLIHNYGHGGSGWSLSWGSAAEVVQLARDGPLREAAVIGCGALGLTAALALQRAGARVTIYAAEFPAETRSARATGSWTPDARVALQAQTDASFRERWERMARTSFAEFQRLLSAPGEAIRVQPRYVVSELPPAKALEQKYADDPIGFVHLEDRIADLWPALTDLAPSESPYAGMYARESHLFRFDLHSYTELLMTEFRQRGGVLERRFFAAKEELAALPQPVVVHCSGYGARRLLGDESLIPVRGQIGWLPAQPEVRYSVQWQNLNVVSRPDGMVVQFGAGGDTAGWQDDNEQPDREESVAAVGKLAFLQASLRA